LGAVRKGTRMKKITKKLQLHRQTLRQLDEEPLRQVGGGNSFDNTLCPGCIDYPTQSPTIC
jgi:hypothetical protein